MQIGNSDVVCAALMSVGFKKKLKHYAFIYQCLVTSIFVVAIVPK